MPDRRRIVALLLPVLLVVGLVAVPARPAAAATTLSCVEYLLGAVICSSPDAPAALTYTTYDPTGQATTPGSYAFLDEAGAVVTTYEGLRDGSATGLVIHKSDSAGTSQAAVYDLVQAGDLFEWRKADDCWVRYAVTEVKADPAGTAPRKHLAIEWMTYAFTGCTGAIAANTAASFAWGPLPDLGGTSLTAPVRHGPFQLVPADWSGSVEVPETYPSPGYSATSPVLTTDLAEARKLPYWRDPALPPGSRLARATSGYVTDPIYGYSATYRGAESDVTIWAYHAAYRGAPEETSWLDGRGVYETRIIAGRPAAVMYSPADTNYDPLFPVTVWVYDPATEALYWVLGENKRLLGSNVDAVIAIARSLFEPPNAP